MTRCRVLCAALTLASLAGCAPCDYACHQAQSQAMDWWKHMSSEPSTPAPRLDMDFGETECRGFGNVIRCHSW
jgi:hypothetical protein